MKIGIVTPAPPRSRYGNRVTALRWANILRKLGYTVTLAQIYQGQPFDLLIALHARRSHDAVLRFARAHPEKPLIVALTGTDLYRDLGQSRRAQQSLDLATRIVLLQSKGLEELQPSWRRKARVIHQSTTIRPIAISSSSSGGAGRASARPLKRSAPFDVCVIGHLRAVKDPFRAALAARRLPRDSRVRVLQVGGAMNRQMAARARAEMKANPRYHWLGEQPRWRVARMLRRCRLLVLSSRMEGGANVLSEAIGACVPVLASRIPGSAGILGRDFPGYFGVGNTRELAHLLRRAETDVAFLDELKARSKKLVPNFDPKREAAAWAKLLAELGFAGKTSAAN